MSHNAERCPHCNEKTLIKITQGEYNIHDSHVDFWQKYSWNIFFCNDCKQVSVIQESYSSENQSQEYDEETGEVYYKPQVSTEFLYPQIKQFGKEYGFVSPVLYSEAKDIFQKGLYNDSIAKCRSVLEKLCSEDFKVKVKNDSLDKKLKEMKKLEYIDEILYEWAIIIKDFGDMATHRNIKETNEYIELNNRNIAQNILNLTGNLIEYSLEWRVRSAWRAKKIKENKAFEYLTQELKCIRPDKKN